MSEARNNISDTHRCAHPGAQGLAEAADDESGFSVTAKSEPTSDQVSRPAFQRHPRRNYDGRPAHR
jgi:hypothetical protein